MNLCNVIGSDGCSTDIIICPVGIEPCMKLHSSFMGLLDHELKRVVVRMGRTTLPAGEPLAPGFQSRRIKCVGCGTDLHNNGVHSVLLVHVQLPYKFHLLAVDCVHAFMGPVNIVDSSNPNSTKFRVGL